MKVIISACTEETEQRLIGWAEWSKSRQDGGLGYPNRSVEGRLKDDGGVLPTSQYKSEVLVNEQAEEIESLIYIMTVKFPILGSIIKMEYLCSAPIKIKAARLQMSRTQFLTYRDQAKAWIDGQLHARLYEPIELMHLPVPLEDSMDDVVLDPIDKMLVDELRKFY